MKTRGTSIGRWAVALAALAAGVVVAQGAEATPIYAIQAANACDTCHIEPLGWANPEQSERFCTMDCNGCHVSPTGGGLRTPSGQFYGKEVLPMWGQRPSSFADPEKYLPKGFPKKGRYSLFEGFSGWWPGSTRMQDIPERYGDIDPNPTFSWGTDYRGAAYVPLDDQDAAIFPMQADLYLMGRPMPNLVLYSSAGLKGSRNRGLGGSQGFLDDVGDLLAVRELFVKVDRIPGNAYVRAGRFAPPFGWRLPDHTSFIRRDLGFDQNRQVFGVEGGYNPNYLFSNAAVFYQGLDGWPGDTGDEGVGASAIAGWRDLGWQVFGNLHLLDRSLKDARDEVAAGVGWGLNLYPLAVLGELDLRRQFLDGDLDDVDAIFAYHELNVLVTRGLTAMLKYDYQDPNLTLKDDHIDRYTLGVQFEPYTYLQAMLQARLNFKAKESVNQEILFILHFWL